MKWDDLLNAPYKAHGRGDGGFDCYGLVLECCRRAGTPLRDVWHTDGGCSSARDVLSLGVNLAEVNRPEAGRVVVMDVRGALHCGYLVDKQLVLHTTEKGARVTPLKCMDVIRIYEVTAEGSK